MPNAPLSPNIQIAIKAATAAAHVIRDGFYSAISSTVKSDQSLVTEYDHQAEQIIVDMLRAETSHAVVSEERGGEQHHDELTWIIDPIDGTTNFTKKLPTFVTSIGLMHGTQPVLGVIVHPLSQNIFYAETGKGAFKNNERIFISGNEDPRKSLTLIETGYSIEDRRLLAHAAERLCVSGEIRMLGSTAFDLCCVASGMADAFLCVGDKIWDFAAGMAIVQEAGGHFTDWRGTPWDNSNTFIYASSKRLDADIREKIQDLQK